MAPMTSAERQRRYREKLKQEDPEKAQRLKKENAERTKSNYKKINQLPEGLKKEQRKKWRQQKQKNKDELKIDQKKEKEKRIVRYRLSKENTRLHRTIENKEKIIRNQRKNIFRLKKQVENLKQLLAKTETKFDELRKLTSRNNSDTKEPKTPLSQTERFVQETIPNIPSPDKEKVKRAIFEGNVIKESLSRQYAESVTKSERDILKNIINNDIVRKYKLKTEFSHSCLGLKGRLREQKRALRVKRMKRIKEIQDFLERDDNSRITAGKRETKTFKKNKKQVRYLQDSLEKLHQKYMDEGGLASYTTFTRYKPFYILDPKITQRNTCACVKHANMTFLAQKLKTLGILETDDLDKLISAIVCDKFNQKCMYNECQKCKNKTMLFDLTNKNKDIVVSWNAWVTKKYEYLKSNNNQENEKKVTKRTTKGVISGTLPDLIKSFTDQIEKFKKHNFNVYHAYQTYKTCKETLSESECMIHCDFSENYLCKMGQEVQATHFGASKQQFTLHTGVLYFKNEENLKEKSFCTISPNNTHNPIAIWTHLTPILEYIKNNLPNVTTLHFFSDGPTTQYRQKGNFYLMIEMTKKMGFQKSTWSFFESAHGKGAADGIGGAVKRTLDKKVTYGEDIVDAQTAYNVLTKCQSKIMYHYISDENVKNMEQEVNLTGLIPVPHTMDLHQVITTEQPDVIQFRILACFCRQETCECFELQEHNLKLKKLKRKLSENKGKTIKQSRYKKSRKAHPDYDSDTSIESKVTYAESDDSDWKGEDESDLYDKCDEDLNKSENNMGIKSNFDDKKIVVLSDIRNTPDNKKYFNLKKYGPFKLNKVDKIEVPGKMGNTYDGPSTSGMNKHSIRCEMENNTKTNFNVNDIKERVIELRAMKEEHIITKENKANKKETIQETKRVCENSILGGYLDRFNTREKKTDEATKVEEEMEEFTYNIKDSVIVRYFEKRSWVYYVGFIENVKKESELTYYVIKFLKTVKKPQLKFQTSKKIDQDTVPADCVVKKIKLFLNASNEYILSDGCNDTYFI